jgi:hypothetical protein
VRIARPESAFAIVYALNNQADATATSSSAITLLFTFALPHTPCMLLTALLDTFSRYGRTAWGKYFLIAYTAHNVGALIRDTSTAISKSTRPRTFRSCYDDVMARLLTLLEESSGSITFKSTLSTCQ